MTTSTNHHSHSRPKQRASQRQQLIAIITENVRHLVRLRSEAAFHKLANILDATGFDINHATSCEYMGGGIIALAPVLDTRHLIDTAHGAVFWRHYDGRSGESWDRADKMADAALAAAGVVIDRSKPSKSGDEWGDAVKLAARKLEAQEARAS